MLDSARAHRGWIVVVAVVAHGAVLAGVSAQTIDRQARQAIASFGDGVIEPVGDAAGDIEIDKALDYQVTRPGSAQWKIVDGKQKGETIGRTISARESSTGTADAAFTCVLGKFQTATLLIEQGSVYRNTEINSQHGTISTFQPLEPVLISGLRRGSPIEQDLSVTVHSLDNPAKVKYRGKLRSRCEVLGRFKVTTPAGTFDSIGVRTTYKGKVGPASVEDDAYVFYAKGVGPVAIRVRSHVSAFLIHNRTEKYSIVLSSAPDSGE